MRPPPSSFFRLLALAVALVGCRDGASPGAAQHQDGSDGRSQGVGVLQGDVYFVGIPCPLIFPLRPPCDGPYPGYEVVVLHASDTTEAARARADSVGTYRVALAPGAYVVFTPRGIDSTIKRRNEARVAAGDTTRLDLLVDTGIR
ncbi:MAG: hypothetical protein ACREMV_09960 [Gemmatimonadales bacterium]